MSLKLNCLVLGDDESRLYTIEISNMLASKKQTNEPRMGGSLYERKQISKQCGQGWRGATGVRTFVPELKLMDANSWMHVTGNNAYSWRMTR